MPPWVPWENFPCSYLHLTCTIGLLAARERKFPNSINNGLPILASKVKVVVPKVVNHYSVRASMSWLSLGQKNVIEVDVDDDYCFLPKALDKAITDEKKCGNIVMACVAYAGDSRTMSIDKFTEIYNILSKHDVWFHVDACHGFQLAFSKKYCDRIKVSNFSTLLQISTYLISKLTNACRFCFRA